MTVQPEVLRVLLVDLAKVVADSSTAETALRQLLCDIDRIAEEVGNTLANAALREKSIADALDSNRSELSVWEERASIAADAGHHNLVKVALQRKGNHASIINALRDQQLMVLADLQILQNQLNALQAMALFSKAHLDVVVARKRAQAVSW